MPYQSPTTPYQSLASLGGFTYPYNPIENQQHQPRAIAYAETLGGGYYTDFGELVTDRTIQQTWPVMDVSFWNSLTSLYTASSVEYTYVDPWGVSMTVVILDLTYKSLLAGGSPALDTVVMKLQVVSIP